MKMIKISKLEADHIQGVLQETIDFLKEGADVLDVVAMVDQLETAEYIVRSNIVNNLVNELVDEE